MAEQRRVEAHDVDALRAASLIAGLEVLLREALAQVNRPRVERILGLIEIAELIRADAVRRKQD